MSPKKRKNNPKSSNKILPDTTDSCKDSSENPLNTLYRFGNPCELASCKRNCKNNPMCISGLGESYWLSKSQPGSEAENSVEELIRGDAAHVGLQNLGATCYVNSLLQLWFHTPQFRKAIFDWNPEEDMNEMNNETITDLDAYQPTSEIGFLQALFSLMYGSKRSYLDPSDFIKSLGLDAYEEQDAQEFSKLFASLLESHLNSQSLPHVKNLVSDNYRGEYSYVTRCSKCKTKSISPSLFYELELNIKGHKTLHECLTEFLKEEKLKGADSYSCDVCKKKQEAARFISIQKLPPIINFQLMRFVYDRKKGDRKKVNSALQFPEVLDMKKYVEGAEEGELMYELTAVLAHRGTSAYSGHYIAHILDDSKNWYTFNDESVKKNKDGKNLNLDEHGGSRKKKARVSRASKGFLSSAAAYMLVYRAVLPGDRSGVESIALSERLQKYADRHNKEFESWIEDVYPTKTSTAEGTIDFNERMRLLVTSLPPPKDPEWSMVEAISTDWIIHWLVYSPRKADPIDNSKIVCSHGSLNPDEVDNVKYINANAAEELYNKYGGGPRLKGELICCQECSNPKTKLLCLKNKFSDDCKKLTILLKMRVEEGQPGFWVGKESLKYWKKQVELTDDLGLNVKSSSDPNDPNKDTGLNLKSSSDPNDPNKDTGLNLKSSSDPNDPNKDTGLNLKSSSDPNDPNKDTGLNLKSSSDPNDPKKYSRSSLEARKQSTNQPGVQSLMEQSTILKTGQKDSFDSSATLSGWESTESVLENLKTNVDKNTKLSKSVSEPVLRRKRSVKNINYLSIHKGKSIQNISSSKNPSKESIKDKSPKLEGDDVPETPSTSKKTDACESCEKNEEKPSLQEEMKKCDEDDYPPFNEDLLCTHGNLCIDESERRLVSLEAWEILRHYFPNCKIFTHEAIPCQECQQLAFQDEVTNDKYRKEASLQKEQLKDIFIGEDRSISKLSSGIYFFVPQEQFIVPWRAFLRKPEQGNALQSFGTSSLLCQHAKMMYHPEIDHEKIYLLKESEWEVLNQFYSVDATITYTCGDNVENKINPELCYPCFFERIEEEKKDFKSRTVYVRKVEILPKSQKRTQKAESLEPKRKRAKLSEEMQLKQMLIEVSSSSKRRKARRKTIRGEKALKVSSNMSVEDFKVLVYKAFNVPVENQHLVTENGKVLNDNSHKLRQCDIHPETTIYLKAQKKERSRRGLEAGFKGTKLYF